MVRVNGAGPLRSALGAVIAKLKRAEGYEDPDALADAIMEARRELEATLARLGAR